MRKVKKLLALLLAVALITGSLAGCATKAASSAGGAAPGSSAAEKAPEADKNPPKVAVVTKLSDMFGAWLSISFKAEGAKYGYQVDSFDYQNEETVFLQIMDNLAQLDYDIVVAQTPKMDARSAIKGVQDTGAVFFHVASQGWEYIRDEKLAQGMVCNEYNLGKLVAEEAAKDLPKDAQVVALLGPAGKQNSIDRYQAYQDVMKEKRPDVKILDAQIANWNKDEGMKKMDDWQQTFPKIDGVLSVNDEMACGAIDSLLANGFTDWDNMYIYGVDAFTNGCTALKNGYMRASAVHDATIYVKKTYELFDLYLKGEYDMKEPKWYDFEPTCIRKEGADAQMAYYKEQGILK